MHVKMGSPNPHDLQESNSTHCSNEGRTRWLLRQCQLKKVASEAVPAKKVIKVSLQRTSRCSARASVNCLASAAHGSGPLAPAGEGSAPRAAAAAMLRGAAAWDAAAAGTGAAAEVPTEPT